ncbi:MAG: hypothetical protein C3F02_01960 [Parcubacteria group bacterium]|nr:MAG: hypothetical protein C3F02_01960 [Parcubacteria group bacterium]
MSNYFRQYIRAVENPLPEMAEYFDKENFYLKNYVTPDSVILDVGCGNGRTMKFLAPYAKTVIGVDYDKKMIAAAGNNLSRFDNAKVIYCDFFHYQFKKMFDLSLASYNLLGSSELDPRRRPLLLQNMLECTKPGKHIVLSVWSDQGIEFANKYYPHIGIRVKKIEGNDVVTDHGIFKRFTKDELNHLAVATGREFQLLELTDIFYLLDLKA